MNIVFSSKYDKKSKSGSVFIFMIWLIFFFFVILGLLSGLYRFYGVFLGVSRWKLEENEFLEQNPP